MKQITVALLMLFGILIVPITSEACSILYYVDADTGKIYVVNSVSKKTNDFSSL